MKNVYSSNIVSLAYEHFLRQHSSYLQHIRIHSLRYILYEYPRINNKVPAPPAERTLSHSHPPSAPTVPWKCHSCALNSITRSHLSCCDTHNSRAEVCIQKLQFTDGGEYERVILYAIYIAWITFTSTDASAKYLNAFIGFSKNIQLYLYKGGIAFFMFICVSITNLKRVQTINYPYSDIVLFSHKTTDQSVDCLKIYQTRKSYNPIKIQLLIGKYISKYKYRLI